MTIPFKKSLYFQRSAVNSALRRIFRNAEIDYDDSGRMRRIDIPARDVEVAFDSIGITKRERLAILSPNLDPAQLSPMVSSSGNLNRNSLDGHLRKVWGVIMDQCYNQNSILYPIAGKRQLKVCEKWHTYDNFKEWALQNIPTFSFHAFPRLVRRNGYDGYSPENCLWLQ